MSIAETSGRMLRRVLRGAQRPIDAFYRHRHPGPIGRALIGMAAPLVRRMVPNDKWSLSVHAPYWMRAAAIAPRGERPVPKRIFMFSLYRGQFTLDLSLAALLAWRGHDVIVGYLPRLGSPVKSPFHDHRSAASYLAAALDAVEASSGGRVRAVDLSEYEDLESTIDQAIVERQAHADAIIRIGRETIDLDESEQAGTLAYYRDLGVRMQRVAHGFFSRRAQDFDLAVIANGMSFESAHVAHVAKAHGLDIVTMEKFAFRQVRIVCHGDVIFSFRDLDLLWMRRRELGYEREPFFSQAIKSAMALLDERRRASQRHWAWKYQFAPHQEADEALRAAKIDPAKPFFLICTNVPFDAGYYRFTRLFASMRDWLIETVRFLLNQTELQVVVRVHPGELLHYGGRECSTDNLAAAGLSPHPRLAVVPADAKVNTYALMEQCRAGAVFSSTTGIEMAMLGRPVVVGADVYYAKKGFTRDCDSRAIYFETLRNAAARDIEAPEGRRVAETARLFYYVLHFVLQHSYPYDKGADVCRIPPHRLVASGDMERYLKFLDVVAMSAAEFAREIVATYGIDVAEEQFGRFERPAVAVGL